ncbi:protein Osi24 [Rhodnius prolixus]|uniref:protein Osi24 n=1 Tax=Rhodnius prolixus TaxID=13249 RepID=UPI003D187A69
MMWCSLVVVLLVELASSVLGHGVKQSNSTSSSIPTSPLANSTRSPADSQPSQDITAILPRLVHQDTLCIPLSFLLEVTNEVSTSPRVAQGRLGFGKNSFLTGFGLGFLAFGLKKLLLPVFIGAQIVKSVLVALFLPTILSHIGKLVGKGLTNVATQSGSSGAHDQVTEFEFKDPVSGAAAGYDAEASASDTMGNWIIPQAQSNAHATLAALNPGRTPAYQIGVLPASAQSSKTAQSISERYTGRLPPIKHYGSLYSKDPQSDFKVFNKIPNSSQLLAHYDPFYSPLLSRLDSVFKQLGTTSEGCRERLVCDMYRNPAKFAPFSNLVSAQLSRELNELRKPSSDNPEILRFFRYMKAAKDGQDGISCETVHTSCIAPTKLSDQASPMLTTFNDINKLVHARRSFTD